MGNLSKLMFIRTITNPRPEGTRADGSLFFFSNVYILLLFCYLIYQEKQRVCLTNLQRKQWQGVRNMKTYFNLNAPVSNMPPVCDSRNNWGDCWYNVFMIQQIFTGLSRLPDLTLRRADIESYYSVKPYTLRGPRLFTNTGASFVSSSIWLLGASSSVLMSVRTKCNELKETLVVGIITMEKYWINGS